MMSVTSTDGDAVERRRQSQRIGIEIITNRIDIDQVIGGGQKIKAVYDRNALKITVIGYPSGQKRRHQAGVEVQNFLSPAFHRISVYVAYAWRRRGVGAVKEISDGL